jgi:hypothetical protein
MNPIKLMIPIQIKSNESNQSNLWIQSKSNEFNQSNVWIQIKSNESNQSNLWIQSKANQMNPSMNCLIFYYISYLLLNIYFHYIIKHPNIILHYTHKHYNLHMNVFVLLCCVCVCLVPYSLLCVWAFCSNAWVYLHAKIKSDKKPRTGSSHKNLLRLNEPCKFKFFFLLNMQNWIGNHKLDYKLLCVKLHQSLFWKNWEK